VAVADGEGAVVEQVVLDGESGDGMRTEIMSPTATVQAGQPTEIQVLVGEVLVSAPLRVRCYKDISDSALFPVMP
jgi:hypothetical protein